jgi:ankyrin repeat protein
MGTERVFQFRLLLVFAVALVFGIRLVGISERRQSVDHSSRSITDEKDGDGTPVIMREVLYGTPSSLKALLQKGANPNATDSVGATALMWAIPDPAKVRLLIQAGADVNASSMDRGRTPLLVAASYPGTVEILKLLLEKGADLRARDRNGRNALGLAAESSEVSVVRFLVERGLDVNEPGPNGAGVLTRASLARDYPPMMDYLLSKGAKIQPQDLAVATHVDNNIVSRMIDRTTDLNVTVGPITRTALANAVAAEQTPLGNIRLLLEKGADPNLPVVDGETPLDWARHRSDHDRIKLLESFGAKSTHTPRDATFPAPEGVPDARTALQRSVTALIPIGPPVFAKRACITCHNQSLPAEVAAIARQKGVAIDEDTAGLNFRQMLMTYKPLGEQALQGTLPAGQELTVGYIAAALAAHKHPADKMTAGFVHAILARQMPDGSWPEFEIRPPMEYSTISRTAMAVRTIRLYRIANMNAETTASLSRAQRWLLATKPASAEEHAMRIMGLVWTDAATRDIDVVVRVWASQQQSDGGWKQLPQLSTDAYATAVTLNAFHEAHMSVNDPVYKNGIAYLLRSQYANGAWFVKTRSFPVQQQLESGFPFGYHQWISAAATSWASLAIGYTLPDAKR